MSSGRAATALLPGISNIRLTVADQSNAALYQQVFTIQPSGPKFVVNFVPALANAKIVKIETTDATPDKFLNLPEVEVFAPLASAPTITFTTNLQPITINENLVPTFGPVAVTVDGGIRPEDISYRWFRNGVEIPNMAGSWMNSYTLPSRVTPANNGDKYKVQASVSGHGVFSAEVVLTVIADTIAARSSVRKWRQQLQKGPSVVFRAAGSGLGPNRLQLPTVRWRDRHLRDAVGAGGQPRGQYRGPGDLRTDPGTDLHPDGDRGERPERRGQPGCARQHGAVHGLDPGPRFPAV